MNAATTADLTNRHAYSVVTVKSATHGKSVVNPGQVVVTIKGVATTPTVDRMNDTVDPKGAVFQLPMPLLWHHNSEKPVGLMTVADVSKGGINFEAELPVIDEPGTLKDRVDEAIQSLKLGLVRAVSIGFNVLEDAYDYVADQQGLHFRKWEWLELSLVTIPANAEATIDLIKALDRQSLRPASGQRAATSVKRPDNRPSVEGKSGASSTAHVTPTQGMKMKTTKEAIQNYEATRQAKAAERDNIMQKSIDDGTTLDAQQKESYDGLDVEIKAIDDQLIRLRDREAEEVKAATRVEGVNAATAAVSRAVGEARSIIVTPKLEKGILFARYAMCLHGAKGDLPQAARLAKQYYPDVKMMGDFFDAAAGFGSVEKMMTVHKASVAAGGTAAGNWAAPLTAYNTAAQDFIEYLRGQTAVDKFGTNGIPSLHRVPFNTHIKAQNAGGSASWVGEGKAKPVTSFGMLDTYHGWFKIAAITVLTKEQMRFSDPSAEALVRDSLSEVVVEKMDTSFLDPAFAGSANVSPPSIFNGATAVTATGTTAAHFRTDIRALWAPIVAGKVPFRSAVYIMDALTALDLSSLMTSLDSSPEFPDLTMTGGRINGVPVIVSDHAPRDTGGGFVGLVIADSINFSDDGEVAIDVSTQAAVEMSTTPAGDALTPTASGTNLVSLWQTNSVGFLAERFCNWSKRRAAATSYIDNAAYTG